MAIIKNKLRKLFHVNNNLDKSLRKHFYLNITPNNIENILCHFSAMH